MNLPLHFPAGSIESVDPAKARDWRLVTVICAASAAALVMGMFGFAAVQTSADASASASRSRPAAESVEPLHSQPTAAQAVPDPLPTAEDLEQQAYATYGG